MKKSLTAAFVLSLILMLSFSVQAFCDTGIQKNDEYVLSVNGKTIDTSDIPKGVYYEGETLMVPLRKTAENLGYEVSWLPDEKEIKVEDGIQYAVMHNGSADVNWTGKLKIINLTHESTLLENAVITDGCTYVPAAFFEDFFNTVDVKENTVSISPVVYQIDDPKYVG